MSESEEPSSPIDADSKAVFGSSSSSRTDPLRQSKKRASKGVGGRPGTRSQGIHLVPLVVKWVRVAGILLAVWMVGYLRFSVSWILIAVLGYVVYAAVYRRKRKAKRTTAPSTVDDGNEETVLARVEELPAWVYFPDTERAEWLNKVIQQMWPYISKLVENILKHSVEPIINRNLPAKLTPFKFEKICLGDIPLRVGGVKTYTDTVKRDEVILDVDIALASDAELTVSVRNITAGVKDIMVQGSVRIVMRPLVNKMPIIGGLSIFFLNQPNIDFDLTDVAKVLDMPLLSTALRTIISDQIANLLVLPNKIPVRLIEDIRAAQIDTVIDAEGVMCLTIIEAADLKRADIGVLKSGKSDPYCIAKVNGQVFVTNVIKNTLTPKWNKRFEVIMESSKDEGINFEVMDKDERGTDDELGSAFLGVDDLPDRGTIDQWLTLENVKTGQLHVKAMWLYLSNDPSDLQKTMALRKESEIESSALLVVHVDSARDLPSSSKLMKEPSPFVSLEIGNRIEKTDPRHASTNPKWEQTFLFLVTDPEVQELTVEVLDSGNNDKKLGDRKIKLSTLLSSTDMAVARPFSLKNAKSECSIRLTVILRILSVSKPVANDNDEEDDDITDEVIAASNPASPVPQSSDESQMVADADVVVVPAMSDTAVGNSPDKPDATGLRFRGLALQRDGRFGQVKLTLRYSGQRQRLIIVIHQCTGLIPCDSDNLADPYVRLYLLPDRSSASKRKTQTKKNDLNPIYDETFEWVLTKAEASSRTLEVMVKNSVSLFSKQRINMGVLHLHLSTVEDLSKPFTDWFDFQDSSATEKSSSL